MPSPPRPCDQDHLNRNVINGNEVLHVFDRKNRRQRVEELEDGQEEEEGRSQPQEVEEFLATALIKQSGGTYLFRDSDPSLQSSRDSSRIHCDNDLNSNHELDTRDMVSCLALVEPELGQEDGLGTDRGIQEELRPVEAYSMLDANPIDKGYRRQHNLGKREDGANDTAEGISSGKSEDEFIRLRYGSRYHFERERPLERERGSQESSLNSMHKRRKNNPQQPTSYQRRSKVIMASSTRAQSPSPENPTTESLSTGSLYNPGVDSFPGDKLPILTEITLRPQSLGCHSTILTLQPERPLFPSCFISS